jgi:hypothetical protein
VNANTHLKNIAPSIWNFVQFFSWMLPESIAQNNYQNVHLAQGTACFAILSTPTKCCLNSILRVLNNEHILLICNLTAATKANEVSMV